MGNRIKNRKDLSFPWEMLEVVLGDTLPLEADEVLTAGTKDDACSFLLSYGFDCDNPIEYSEIFGAYQEALTFIRRFFLKPVNRNGLETEIPSKFLEIKDPRQVMVLGRGNRDDDITQWAVSIIKVMHTIAHVDRDLRSHYFKETQEQILDRYYKVVLKREDGTMSLGDPEKDKDAVPLVGFEVKPKKARDSMILKLLHKPESVAEEIFDRIGLRFVTENIMDALLVIKFLASRYIFIPANIKPSRCRNTLIDIIALKERSSELYQQFQSGKISESELYVGLNELCSQNVPEFRKPRDDNPFSSTSYRAIQFTASQLIKHKNPLFDDLRSLRDIIRKTSDGGLSDAAKEAVEKIDMSNIKRELKFFYPYEVQILDKKAHEDSQRGEAAHLEYKRSQLVAAMKRIMGPLYTKYSSGAAAEK